MKKLGLVTLAILALVMTAVPADGIEGGACAYCQLCFPGNYNYDVCKATKDGQEGTTNCHLYYHGFGWITCHSDGQYCQCMIVTP